MTRSAWNFTVDCLLATLLISHLFTTTVLAFVFPNVTQAEGWTVWGWSYRSWQSAHFVIIGVFALTVLLHLVLHWTWVIGFVSARLSSILGRRIRVMESEKTLYGVSTLILVLTFLIAIVFSTYVSLRGPQNGTPPPGATSLRPGDTSMNGQQPVTQR